MKLFKTVYIYALLFCLALAGCRDKDVASDNIRSRLDNIRVVYRDSMQYKKAMSMCKELEDNTDVRNDESLQLELYMLMENIAMTDCRDLEALRCANKVEALAKKLGRPVAQYKAIFDRGQLLFTAGEIQVGTGLMRQGISGLEQHVGDAADAPLRLSTCYGEMMSSMISEHEPLLAMQYGRKREKLLSTVKDNGRSSDLARAYLYSKMAQAAWLADSPSVAKECYVLFNRTKTSRTQLGNRLILDYLHDSRQYGEMVRVIHSLYETVGGDTLSEDYARAVLYESDAMMANGEYEKAARAKQKVISLGREIISAKATENFFETSAVYRMRELSRENMEKESRLKYTYTFIAVVMILLVACVVGVFSTISHNRTIRDKNKALTKSIEQLRMMTRELQQLQPGEPEIASDGHEEGGSEDTAAGLHEGDTPADGGEPGRGDAGLGEKDAHNELYKAKLERIVERDNLYKSQRIDAKFVAQRLHITQTRVREIFGDKYGDTGLREFVVLIRLRHACDLLKNESGYTIDYISQEVGFNNLRTFQRAFKQYYGMSPKEYRDSVSVSGRSR